MKKEVIWFPIILALVALSIFVIVKKPTKFGLDINGGLRAVLQVEPKPGQSFDMPTVLRILENRLNSSGVSEPSITQKGTNQIVVELPNVSNKDQLIQELATTAQMEFLWFRDVQSQRNRFARFEAMPSKDAAGHDQYSFMDTQTHDTFRDQGQIVADFQSSILGNAQARPKAVPTAIPQPLGAYAPTGETLYLDPTEQARVQSLNTELTNWNNFYNMELAASGSLTNSPPQPMLTGADIKPNATSQLGGSGVPEPTCNLQFTDKGAQEFGDFTRNHVGEILAIVLDGRVITAPNINEPILDGNCEISGGFASIAEAQQLANLINAGALPVPLSIQQVDSVEATLGHAAVQNSIKAGLIGLGLVLLFMAAYYLLPGIVADIALLFYGIFALAIFKGALSWFIPSVTLTLPGIAGFILSVGMAVDANILIFERLKEELRNGKPLRQAIDSGFKRAFTAIRDSNICTLITCFILGTMGTPSVKGFAITLGIGVVVSLFTAITATRTMLYLLVDLGVGNNPVLFGLKRQWVTGNRAAETGPGTPVYAAGGASSNVNVIRNRKVYYAISLAIIIPGIIFYCLGGLKKSIEFKGGTQVEAVFNSVVSQDSVRKALIASGYKDSLVQMAEGGKIAIVTVPALGNPAQDAVEYLKVVNPAGGPAPTPSANEVALDRVGTPYKMQSHSFVGPSISKELTTNAFQAVLIAAMLIVIYMASVFAIGGFVAGLRFGTSAIVALLHDVLVLIGSFAILGYFLDWQIDSLFVTATLTVVGFSVHDTIVIFDRLRENLRHKLKNDSFEDLANRSVLQSFARSINTSLTVVLTLLAMLIVGEPSTRLLIVALLIGIVSGTYSSIFNATPILVDWENWIAKRRASMPVEMAPTLATAGAGSLNGGSLFGSPRKAEEPKVVKSMDSVNDGAPGRPSVTKAKKKVTRRF